MNIMLASSPTSGHILPQEQGLEDGDPFIKEDLDKS
jgi:hypothetical protein